MLLLPLLLLMLMFSVIAARASFYLIMHVCVNVGVLCTKHMHITHARTHKPHACMLGQRPCATSTKHMHACTKHMHARMRVVMHAQNTCMHAAREFPITAASTRRSLNGADSGQDFGLRTVEVPTVSTNCATFVHSSRRTRPPPPSTPQRADIYCFKSVHERA